MAFDPEDKSKVSKLLRAIEWSDARLRVRREQRLDHIRQLVGKWYGEHGAPDNVPINLIELGVSIFQRQIASRNPQAMIDSRFLEFSSASSDLELAVNYEIERMCLSDAINDCGIEALFAMGVMLVGIVTNDTPADEEGYQRDPGHVFADSIPFEDLILDMASKRKDTLDYVGNKFRVPFEWVKDNPRYDKKVRDRLTAPTGEESIADGDIDPDTMSRGTGPLNDEYQDYIDLMQVYLPGEKIITTLVCGQDELPLATVNWRGPEHGPYHFLSFGKVPSNVVPLAPVPLWYDLHDFTNQCFNKVIDQALRQKTVTVIPRSAGADADTFVNARDGDAIPLDDPNSVKEVNNGGANPATLAMSIQAKDLMSALAGNLEALGGISAQSGTVGQDQLLFNNASGRVKDMQDKMVEFTTGIVRDIAYWMWENPLSEYHLIKPIEGAPDGIPGIPVTWTPESRQGRFFDYNIRVNPYSLPPQSPSEASQVIVQTLTQIIIPVLPALQAQGMDLDWEYVFKTLAKYQNRPEIARMIRFMNGEAHPQRGAVEPRMAANTTRTHIRENRSAATQIGKDRTLIEQLMGGNPQGNEMANLARAAV